MPGGVIGNTGVFGTLVSGSSPDRAANPLKCPSLPRSPAVAILRVLTRVFPDSSRSTTNHARIWPSASSFPIPPPAWNSSLERLESDRVPCRREGASASKPAIRLKPNQVIRSNPDVHRKGSLDHAKRFVGLVTLAAQRGDTAAFEQSDVLGAGGAKPEAVGHLREVAGRPRSMRRGSSTCLSWSTATASTEAPAGACILPCCRTRSTSSSPRPEYGRGDGARARLERGIESGRPEGGDVRGREARRPVPKRSSTSWSFRD